MLVVEAERIRLRPLTLDDAGFVLQLLNEPSFLEHIGDRGVRSMNEAIAYIASGPMMMRATYGFGLDCVELKESGVPIGICGLLKRPALADIDVGYALLPEFWSKGYAKEAVLAVLGDARDRLGFQRVAAIVRESNPASIGLLERLGFRYERMVSLIEGQPEVRLYALEL